YSRKPDAHHRKGRTLLALGTTRGSDPAAAAVFRRALKCRLCRLPSRRRSRSARHQPDESVLLGCGLSEGEGQSSPKRRIDTGTQGWLHQRRVTIGRELKRRHRRDHPELAGKSGIFHIVRWDDDEIADAEIGVDLVCRLETCGLQVILQAPVS